MGESHYKSGHELVVHMRKLCEANAKNAAWTGQARYALQLAAGQLAELLAWQQARLADRDHIEVERLRRELADRDRTIASLREGIASTLMREPVEEQP